MDKTDPDVSQRCNHAVITSPLGTYHTDKTPKMLTA